MKVKHLKKGELRVIRIDHDAIYELLREDMMDHAEKYFDILDETKVHFNMIWDSETDEFLCVINDDRHPLKIDIESLLKDVPKTTDSLYSPSRYKTIYL